MSTQTTHAKPALIAGKTLNQKIAITRIAQMFQGAFFDKGAFDAAAKLLGRKFDEPTLDQLRALHCGYFEKMPTEISAHLYDIANALIAD